MLDEYDFSHAKPNPFAQRLREQTIITLEPDVYQAIQEQAAKDNLSLHQEIHQILRLYLQTKSLKLEDILRSITLEQQARTT